MAVHLLNRPSDIGEIFGQGFGKGLGKAMSAKETQKGLEAIGFDPDKARKIAFSHPYIIQEAVRNKFQEGQAKNQNNYLQETIGNIQRGYALPPQGQQQEAPADQLNRLNPQQNPLMSALDNLKNYPAESLLNPEVNQYQLATHALDKLKNAPYEHLAQQLMNKVTQPQKVQQAPEPKKFTAADIDWSKLSPQQALQVQGLLDRHAQQEEKQSLAKEGIELRKQAAIDKQVSPFLKESREGLQQTKEVVKLTDEISELMKAPDIQLGSIKSLTPNRFQNASTQALVSKLNELVTKKAQLGKGVPSRMRLVLEQTSKPQIWQKPDAIQYIVNSLRESASEAVNKQSIINDVIALNNGNNPKNLEHVVDKISKIYPELPDTNGIKEGQKIKAGPFKFINEQGQWHYIGA